MARSGGAAEHQLQSGGEDLAAVPSVGRANSIEGPAAPEADVTHALYERHAAQIFRYCLHQLGSREEAEDAVQSTFLNAFRGLKRGIVPEAESAWLFKIAHNVCLSRRRSSWRRDRVESPTDFEVVEEVTAAPSRRADELIGLQDVLEQMPEQQRRAILLREWQGLSYREIGEELELSQGAVETLIFRARRSLANGLEQPAAQRRRRRLAGGALGNLLASAQSFVLGGGAAAKVAAVVVVAGAGTVAATAPTHRPHVVAPPAPAPARVHPSAPSAPAPASTGLGRAVVPVAPAAAPPAPVIHRAAHVRHHRPSQARAVVPVVRRPAHAQAAVAHAVGPAVARAVTEPATPAPAGKASAPGHLKHETPAAAAPPAVDHGKQAAERKPKEGRSKTDVRAKGIGHGKHSTPVPVAETVAPAQAPAADAPPQEAVQPAPADAEAPGNGKAYGHTK